MLLIWTFQLLPFATQPISSVLTTLRYAFLGLGCVTMNQNVLTAVMNQKTCVKTKENVEAVSHPLMAFLPHHHTQTIIQKIQNVSSQYWGPVTQFWTWHLWCLICMIVIIMITLKLEMVLPMILYSLADSPMKPTFPHLSKPLKMKCGWGEKRKLIKTQMEKNH